MTDHTTRQSPEVNIPYGYCHCGCGQKTSIAPCSNAKRGYLKGEPYKFVHRHNSTWSQSIESSFWRFFTPGDPDACWEWKGSICPDGYGFVIFRRQHVRAHRFSYELHNGPIPDGISVLHKCDNPPCCNPNHLFLGTRHDNIKDMVAKKRHCVGSQKRAAKITEDDVLEIRRLYNEGVYQRVIGERFGVDQSCVSNILRRKTWKHVP